jgi:ACS family glucarate transporter-like MFS transporter
LNDASHTGSLTGVRPTHTRYIVVGFMMALAMVTYLDRACIGTMKTSIQAEFGLTEGQFSWVFVAFGLSYALFEIPTARWADRRGAKGVFSRIVIWWSAFTLLTAAAWNYVSLLVTRFLFGAGEAGAFPCMARVLSRWMPFRERGTAKGIFFASAYTAGGLTPIIVGYLMLAFSWREILVMFGFIGLVWVAAWHWWYRDEPTEHPRANEAERQLIVADRPPPRESPVGWAFWRNLLRQRNVRLLCFLYMPNCATFYYCITWLPSYLEMKHGFVKTELGIYASLPLLLAIPTQFLGGYLSDRITRRHGTTAGRRIPGIVGYGLAAVCIVAASLATQPQVAALCIAFAASTCMLTTAPAWSTCVDIGREHSGTVSATMNTAGQLAAISVAPITGYSVDWFDNWNVPFWLLAGLFVMGAICWMFVEPEKPVIRDTLAAPAAAAPGAAG